MVFGYLHQQQVILILSHFSNFAIILDLNQAYFNGKYIENQKYYSEQYIFMGF